MKINFQTLIFSLIVFPGLSFSQGWQHKFGGTDAESANAVIQTTDGGFLVTGSSKSYGGVGNNVFVVKTTSQGKLQWQQVVSTNGEDIPYAVVQNTAGEYYIAGQTNGLGAGGLDVYVVKLSATGTVLWTNTYGGALDDYATSMVINASNEIVLAGTTKSSGAGGNDAYLLKINSSGTLVWSKVIGKTGNEIINGIKLVHDGGFILAGTTSSFSTNYGYAIRTNSNGDTLWTKSYNVGTLNGTGFKACAELNSNTQFAFAGYGGSISYGHLVTVLTDLNGTASSTTYSGLLADGGQGIISTTDGGFATISYYCNFGCRIVLTKFNSAGTKLWNKYYITGSGNSYATFSDSRALSQTSDGGFIIGGTTYLPGVQPDVVLIKTDGNGTIPNDYISNLTANGATEFCSGGSVQLSAPTGFDHYQWLQFVGNSITWLPNTDTVAINVSASGSYQCVMTNADGVYFSYLKTVTVNSIPAASISASSALSFCGPVQNITLTAPSGTNTTYVWKLNNATINGATSSTYNPVASGSYTVTMTNVCGSSTSAASVISNNLAPTASISSPFGTVTLVNGIVCEPYQLSVSSQSGSSYVWYRNGVSYQSGSNILLAFQQGTYYAVVTNSCGSSTSTNSVIQEYNYNSFITSSSNSSGCGSFPVTLISPYSADGTYQWYLNGSPIPGAISDTYQATGNGSYTCQNTVYCGGSYFPSTTNPFQVNLNGTPLPNATLSATGPATVCSGTVTLNVAASGATYIWRKDGIIISGATSQSYVATSSGNYDCVISTANCGSVTSNLLFVKIGTPTATITSGSTNICDGSSLNLNISTNDPASTFTSIQWRKDGVNISGANSTSYAATIAGVYDCIISNICGPITTNAITLTLNPINTSVSPSGTVPLCPGLTTVLNVPSVAGATYQWNRNGNSISGANQASYPATQSGSYTVRVSLSNCIKYSSAVNVVLQNLPSPNIWSSTLPEFCNTGSVQLNANTQTGFTYNWKRNNVTIAGATGASYNATLGGNYKVTITDSAGCVMVSPDFPVKNASVGNFAVTASGPVTFCNGGNVVLTSSLSGSSYQWSRNNSAIQGSTGINFTADTIGYYTITVTNAQGCSGKAGIFVNEFNQIVISTVITPPSCGASNGSISISVANAGFPVTYLWSNGVTTSSVSNLSAGVYTVVVTDVNGCSNQATVNLVQAAPPATITPTGPTSFCAGGSVTLNANNGAGLTYQWKKYGNVIPGATSSTYVATGTGVYKVTVSDANGCSANSSTVSVTSLALPTASITASGSTSICPGSSVNLNANTGAGLTYQWRKYSNDIAGATNSTYAVTGAGQYKVRVTNVNGCSKNSNTITVTTLPAPTATITANGPTSFCAGDSVKLTANSGAGLSYQWKKGSNNIAGATLLNYTAKNAGNYKVTVTGSNGCSKNSNVIAVSVPCRVGELTTEVGALLVKVSPNPSTDIFNLNVEGSIDGEVNVLVQNIEGKNVTANVQFEDARNFKISGLNSGIYFIIIHDNTTVTRTRIICTK